MYFHVMAEQEPGKCFYFYERYIRYHPSARFKGNGPNFGCKHQASGTGQTLDAKAGRRGTSQPYGGIKIN
jgi:hypothetical protein